jgi:hypothetical protein
MATHPLAVEVVADRDDLVEIRRDTRIDPRHGTHPEHTGDALSSAGVFGLDIKAVPFVPDVMLTAEPRQRIPEIFDQPILEPPPRTARLGGEIRGETDQIERDI